MLELKFIRENQALVARSAREKGYKIDIDDILELDEKHKKELTEVEKIRQERNEVAAQMKGGKPEPELIEKGKKIKEKLAEKQEKLAKTEQKLQEMVKKVPNVIFDDVPLGGEEDSVEIKRWGEKRTTGVDHLDYATERGWLDFERGAKVAGTKFYYLKGDLALLENALLQYALKKVTEAGFTFMTVPDLVSSRVLEGCGFNPRSSEQSDEYFVEGEDLALIATAEMPLTGYHMDEIIPEEELPCLYAGYSACFRKEAGSYGKYTRGLFRVHQFNKLEMYIFCLPEQSLEMHEKILGVEESIWQDLKIPYHVVNIAAGDLGAPAAKKYDIEYWSPVNQKYQELTSCSNCTDFQAQAVNCRVRRKDGKVELAHTLNGTAVSMARTLVALMENYATTKDSPEGGLMTIPEPLRPYLGGRAEI